MQNKQHKMEKPEADLILNKTNQDPEGNHFYHPDILKYCIAGALTAGILLAAVAFFIAYGTLPVKGLGQIAAASYGAIVFFGFITGSAIGGLFGSVYGLFIMLNKK